MDQRTTRALREDQAILDPINIHVDEISQSDLARGHEIRKRVDEKSLDRSLQVTSAVFVIQSFLQQHVFRCFRTLENELGAGRLHDAILNSLKFEIENLTQVMFFQRTEHYHLVDPVHELRRELASRSLDGGAINLLVYFGIVRRFRTFSRRETNAAG